LNKNKKFFSLRKKKSVKRSMGFLQTMRGKFLPSTLLKRKQLKKPIFEKN